MGADVADPLAEVTGAAVVTEGVVGVVHLRGRVVLQLVQVTSRFHEIANIAPVVFCCQNHQSYYTFVPFAGKKITFGDD
jgi:hypothetical protein